MSDNVTPTRSAKSHLWLLASFALNIFLIAFVLGRFSMMMPPSFDRHLHGPHCEMHGGMPHGPGGPQGEMGGDMPPPPPLFAPEDLFSPDEMKEDFAKMDESFKAVQKLREDFARQLKAGSVTADQALAHFAEVDKIMDATKKQLQEKAAKKIASLSPEERSTFADKLLDGWR